LKKGLPLPRLGRYRIHRVLNQVAEELSKNAEAYPALKGQFADLRKYRVGDYGVIYAILGDEVLVLRIGHRKGVYKKE